MKLKADDGRAHGERLSRAEIGGGEALRTRGQVEGVAVPMQRERIFGERRKA
jgi:hypothetical protein